MLHTILQVVGFFGFLYGMAGICGAIEFGEGWTASIVIVLMSALLMYIGFKEEGGFRSGDDRRR